MPHLIQRLVAGRRHEDGASAVEYGLLVAAIAAIVVVIVFSLGGVVKSVFNTTCTTLQAKAATAETCTSS